MREKRLRLNEIRGQIEKLSVQSAELEVQIAKAQKAIKGCGAIDKLLEAERQSSIEKHIAAYGPLITNIQQRLRSVYGFGSVQLKARGGEAAVEVEWRNKSVQVAPTDFFSDSQKQILMLSIFLAGGLRQNWSGFAPVLLDDPVTHFDDLNAYGFVELIRGIVTSQPRAFQFIISTCEDRLFSLMKKKFTRVEGGAIFYEYLGMSANGPIIEQHHVD
jgi:exonuclease SbcC